MGICDHLTLEENVGRYLVNRQSNDLKRDTSLLSKFRNHLNLSENYFFKYQLRTKNE